MLGLGWTEMLVIGVVALIFIGPKDLPVVMGRVGKIIGQVQRMGREFQREINKTTGLDEVRNLRTSITSPLKKTADEIRRDFNAIGKDGKEQPSGALKPTDSNTESVVDAIQQQAGMAPASPVKKTNDELAADYGFKSAKAESATTESVKAEPVKAVRTPAKTAVAKSAVPAKSKAARTKAALAEAEAATAIEPVVKPASKATASKSAKPAAGVANAKPAAKPRAPRKKPTEVAGKSE